MREGEREGDSRNKQPCHDDPQRAQRRVFDCSPSRQLTAACVTWCTSRCGGSVPNPSLLHSSLPPTLVTPFIGRIGDLVFPLHPGPYLLTPFSSSYVFIYSNAWFIHMASFLSFLLPVFPTCMVYGTWDAPDCTQVQTYSHTDTYVWSPSLLPSLPSLH